MQKLDSPPSSRIRRQPVMRLHPGAAAAEPEAEAGEDEWLAADLTSETYLLAIFQAPADEFEARPVVRICQTDSDRVDELFMQANNMVGLHVLDLRPAGADCFPRLLKVAEVLRCRVPARRNRLVTLLITVCGLRVWMPGEGALEALEPAYRICNFDDQVPTDSTKQL